MSDYVYATADEALKELQKNPSKYQTLESLQKLALGEKPMNFRYENISQADIEKFGIIELGKKYRTTQFDWWIINEQRDIYLLLAKETTNIDDVTFGTAFYVLNIKGLWVDLETETISYGGEYKGETWEKNGIKKISPYMLDSSGKKQILKINELPISYEAIVSIFCEMFTVSSVYSHRKSIKHIVTFENIAQVEGA